MNPGTLYGIGVGPGDPEWINGKGRAAARRVPACVRAAVARGGRERRPAKSPRATCDPTPSSMSFRFR